MRTITDHKVNGLNEAIEVIALDEPGSGGANHEYLIGLNVPVDVPHWDVLAKSAYDAYCGSRDWKSVRGEPLPQFPDQSPELRSAWRVAAQAAAERHVGLSSDAMIHFQNGPISSPEDRNGLTNEAILAVVIDRMRGFQSGPFKCRENAIALTHLEEAMMWLQKRTRDRMARGVEGKNQA